MRRYDWDDGRGADRPRLRDGRRGEPLMEPWLVVAAVVLVAVGLALWLTWTANRLDRIHHRIDVARAALDAQLLRRSGAALELATSDSLDPPSRLVLVDAAHHARNAGPDEVETAESILSQALRRFSATRRRCDCCAVTRTWRRSSTSSPRAAAGSSSPGGSTTTPSRRRSRCGLVDASACCTSQGTPPSRGPSISTTHHRPRSRSSRPPPMCWNGLRHVGWRASKEPSGGTSVSARRPTPSSDARGTS